MWGREGISYVEYVYGYNFVSAWFLLYLRRPRRRDLNGNTRISTL